MKQISKIKALIVCLPAFLIFLAPVNAQEIPSQTIDGIVERSMQTFNVPGISLAFIKDGIVIHNKGYGVLGLDSNEKVDSNTLFAIASNTKAFTSAALGILVDEKKLHWDDRIIDYIPEFRLYNPHVTEEFTIRDLLTHRSGLGLGAGDLMIFPDSNDFTVDELIHNMRYLKPVSGFRSRYDYDNLLYIVAGEVVARVSGISWESFVEQRIMGPLGMDRSAANFHRLNEKNNIAVPHAVVNGKLEIIDRYDLDLTSSAGAIYSSINDMAKWVIMQLNRGKYGDEDKQLFSEDVHREMWTPQTIITRGTGGIYNTHFNSYGLGWRLSDVNGYLQVSHTGGLPGMVTQVALLPELNLGIVVLTNQHSRESFVSITNHIKDFYFGISGVDHVQNNLETYHVSIDAASEEVKKVWDKVFENLEKPEFQPESFSGLFGTYKDNWFGKISISSKDGKMRWESKRSPKLAGDMFWYKGNTYVVKWDDRSLDADAFVLFELDFNGMPSGIRMKAISPLTDFSYDFQDLDFYRVKDRDY